MATPQHGLRRVPFGASDAPSRGSALPPSPYTPFGSRRASLTPSVAASAPPPRAAGAAVALDFARPESADAFARGGAEAALRNACLDVVSAVGGDAHALAQEVAAALDVQLSFAADLRAERGAHAYAKREVLRVEAGLRIELETWTLVHTAWRAGDVRPRDMCSMRAALRFEEDWMTCGDAPAADACRRVLEWLEATAGERLDREGGPRVRPLDDPAYRWQYTSGRLGAVPSADYPLRHGREHGDGVCALEEVELKADRRLAREVFRLVRCGRAAQAEELCRQVGQPWRAAVLAGGQRASELSAGGVKGGARRAWRRAAAAIAGSTDTAVAAHERAVCAVLAGVLEPVLCVAETHEDLVWARLSVLLDAAVERSLVNAARLAGEVEGSVEATSGDESMEDVDGRKGGGVVERAARAASALIAYEDILEAFRESKIPGEGLDGVPAAVVEHARMVRAYLGLGAGIPRRYVVALMEEVSQLSVVGRELGVEWACRFAAHVALFVKKTGLLAGAGAPATHAFEQVMVSYSRLALDQELAAEVSSRTSHVHLPVRPVMYDLVARHLAELETVDQLVGVYTEVMACALRGDLREEWSLVDKPGATVRQVHTRRTLCLQRAGKCFGSHGRDALNTLVVASVDYVWDEYLPGFASHNALLPAAAGGRDDAMHDAAPGDETASNRRDTLGGGVVSRSATEFDEMTRDDQLVIRAIEFLVFPGFGNYPEALRRATAAARRFFLLGKRASARHVVEWFPAEALSQIPPGGCENELHELDCWRAYMVAVSRHNEWRSYYFSARPAALPPAVRAAALANPGEVSYEVQAAATLRLEAYTQQLEAYSDTSAAARDAAIAALRAALLHDGGWMRELRPADDDPAPDPRAREARAVRRVGVPQLAALLHNVLHESGLHADATALVALVADDGRRLYEDFDGAELAAFLKRVAQSAVLSVDAHVRDGGAHPYPAQMFEELPAAQR